MQYYWSPGVWPSVAILVGESRDAVRYEGVRFLCPLLHQWVIVSSRACHNLELYLLIWHAAEDCHDGGVVGILRLQRLRFWTLVAHDESFAVDSNNLAVIEHLVAAHHLAVEE